MLSIAWSSRYGAAVIGSSAFGLWTPFILPQCASWSDPASLVGWLTAGNAVVPRDLHPKESRHWFDAM